MPPRKAPGSNIGMLNTFLTETVDDQKRMRLFANEGKDLTVLQIDDIEPNPDQPRRHFDPESLQGLADSIREHGVLQPVLVRKLPDGQHRLIAGERRLRASRMAGLSAIPAMVTTADDDATLGLIENLQREDLDALELAHSLRALLERHATQADLAKATGKSESYVSRVLRILDLPAAILDEYPAHRSRVSVATLVTISEGRGEQEQLQRWEAAKNGTSSKALRQVRAGDAATAPRESAVSVKRVVSGSFRLTKSIDAITGSGVALDGKQRAALEQLRDKISALLTI